MYARQELKSGVTTFSSVFSDHALSCHALNRPELAVLLSVDVLASAVGKLPVLM